MGTGQMETQDVLQAACCYHCQTISIKNWLKISIRTLKGCTCILSQWQLH